MYLYIVLTAATTLDLQIVGTDCATVTINILGRKGEVFFPVSQQISKFHVNTYLRHLSQFHLARLCKSSFFYKRDEIVR